MDYENIIPLKTVKRIKYNIYFVILKSPSSCWLTMNNAKLMLYFENKGKFLSLNGLNIILKNNREDKLNENLPGKKCTFCNKVYNFNKLRPMGKNGIYLHNRCALELVSLIKNKIPEKLKPKIISKEI